MRGVVRVQENVLGVSSNSQTVFLQALGIELELQATDP